ncbi:uncharacterized protein HaLaN_27190 [Haematococcus lacustris]|uniref:Uncharacterized protein n=1 Tax=Haematococcus lacustris TaxID=44745 RepID=A0A6A0A7Q9_HAELA|nr:uncharacterized protein HaLaN_27190 [Haematococcus lacustris]
MLQDPKCWEKKSGEELGEGGFWKRWTLLKGWTEDGTVRGLESEGCGKGRVRLGGAIATLGHQHMALLQTHFVLSRLRVGLEEKGTKISKRERRDWGQGGSGAAATGSLELKGEDLPGVRPGVRRPTMTPPPCNSRCIVALTSQLWQLHGWWLGRHARMRAYGLCKLFHSVTAGVAVRSEGITRMEKEQPAADPLLTRAARLWAQADNGDEWEEKWGETHAALGAVTKYADKWAKDGANVWHEKWVLPLSEGLSFAFKYRHRAGQCPGPVQG